MLPDVHNHAATNANRSDGFSTESAERGVDTTAPLAYVAASAYNSFFFVALIIDTHCLSEQIESCLREKIPFAGRIIISIEPTDASEDLKAKEKPSLSVLMPSISPPFSLVTSFLCASNGGFVRSSTYSQYSGRLLRWLRNPMPALTQTTVSQRGVPVLPPKTGQGMKRLS